ncbi:hypothetical protein KAI32_02910 [Candidatus Pacearchaeota archaeon]|nr:hypothetical protein [Candidatus Pacearchaeota archaeon]
MDYGGSERRRTKGDLKRKGIAGRYKRGGKFRTQGVSEEGGDEKKEEKKLKKGKFK